jgi:hypothetical protein
MTTSSRRVFTVSVNPASTPHRLMTLQTARLATLHCTRARPSCELVALPARVIVGWGRAFIARHAIRRRRRCDIDIADSSSDSGCGWPAFFDTIPGAVVRHEDKSMFTTRTEIVCANWYVDPSLSRSANTSQRRSPWTRLQGRGVRTPHRRAALRQWYLAQLQGG